MFLKNAAYDGFTAELEENLYKVAQAPLVRKYAYQEKALKHLLIAAELLDEVGFEKHASIITSIMEKFAWEVPQSDPATSNLTSEKMVSNLEEKGWVFNVDDGDIVDVAEPEPGETVELQPDGEIEVSDSEKETKTAARVTWPRDGRDPYGEEEIDLDLIHLLKKN